MRVTAGEEEKKDRVRREKFGVYPIDCSVKAFERSNVEKQKSSG